MSRPAGPVCVPCKVAMRPTNNDASLEVMAVFGSYELYMADEWTCPNCGHTILTGFGYEPLSSHVEPSHPDIVARFPERVQVQHG